MNEPTGTLEKLQELADAETAAQLALRQAVIDLHRGIYEVMSVPHRERGVSTYEIAAAVGLSRQQMHQIYRDLTVKGEPWEGSIDAHPGDTED